MLSKARNRPNARPALPAIRAARFEQERNFAGNNAPAAWRLMWPSTRAVQVLARGETKLDLELPVRPTWYQKPSAARQAPNDAARTEAIFTRPELARAPTESSRAALGSGAPACWTRIQAKSTTAPCVRMYGMAWVIGSSPELLRSRFHWRTRSGASRRAAQRPGFGLPRFPDACSQEGEYSRGPSSAPGQT